MHTPPAPTTADDDFERARALFLGGLQALQENRLAQAEAAFRQALDLVPDRASTRINLATTLQRQGRFDESLPLAEAVLAAEPDNVDALFQRGAALAARGEHAGALAMFERLVAVSPRPVAEAEYRRGQMLQALGRFDEALDAYARVLSIAPTHADAWTNRGNLLREAGRHAEAADCIRTARAHGADAELMDFYLAALSSDPARPTPATAPDFYVAALFDQYAGDFDAHLARLGYRAHAMLVEQVRAEVPQRFHHALDLGCGTGLSAPLLRPLALRLTGVDLSAGMLARARALGLYDELFQADAVAYLRGTSQRHDLVLAADVLIYLGELTPLFESLAACMPPGGVFAFTVEQPTNDLAFELRPSLRYAHSQAYLRSLADRHGFAVRRMEQAALREEQGRPVPGLLVQLARAAA